MHLHRYTAIFSILFSVINAQSYYTIEKLTTAHGTCASVAFLIFFPAAAIIIRLATFRHAIWVHAALQVIGYSLFIAGAGMGIYLGKTLDLLNNKHPIIGMFLLAMLFFQSPTGLLHHYFYKRQQKRTIPSYWHVWIGRALVILGMVNGGLGLQLGLEFGFGKHKWYIAYGVVAGVMGAAWLLSAAYGEFRRFRSKSTSTDKEMEDANSAER